MKDTLHLQPVITNHTCQQLVDGLKEAKDENQLRFFENLFYKKHVNYIYHVAINKCRNFSDAEDLAKDITQETFINAFKAIKKFSFSTDAPVTQHGNILKAWLGKIGNNCFLKVYKNRKKEISIDDDAIVIDNMFCPLCSELLLEEESLYVCSRGHYKTERSIQVQAQELPEDFNTFNLFDSLYGEPDVEVTNEFRNKLQHVIITIKEDHMHILMTYVAEGCINSTRHLSPEAMDTLCKTFDTSPENIRQIKKRTLDKIKSHCFATNN